MLRWEKDINGYNGHWMGGYIGFDDDCPLYKVGEDENGWYYEYLPDADGMDGYDTAEEAMAVAEEDYASWTDWEEEEEEEAEGFGLDIAFWEYWDWVMEERRERAAGLYD